MNFDDDDEEGMGHNDSEDVDNDDDEMMDPAKKGSGSKAGAAKEIKGDKLEN